MQRPLMCESLTRVLALAYPVRLQVARSGSGLFFDPQICGALITSGPGADVYLQSTGKSGRFNITDKKDNVYPEMALVKFIPVGNSGEYFLQRRDGKILGYHRQIVNPPGLLLAQFYHPQDSRHPSTIRVKVVRGDGDWLYMICQPQYLSLPDDEKPQPVVVRDDDDKPIVTYRDIINVGSLVMIAGMLYFFLNQAVQ